ncbi:EAL and HDOD domain-containing protein [Paraferrimonas sedimenticola]|uniref:Diguanylate phosphodiesterase n=1 Tax=Paraferrimonas sedimenticola TaxID=375674 RepID=A0AA37VT07_9GAMM|nr:HDOD domain-containing protein [Paraferrimonas sedimenticola]GLP95079.1 diguanylate phosphodiesterase [Paraferrimonas sedimenticola]
MTALCQASPILDKRGNTLATEMRTSDKLDRIAEQCPDQSFVAYIERLKLLAQDKKLMVSGGLSKAARPLLKGWQSGQLIHGFSLSQSPTDERIEQFKKLKQLGLSVMVDKVAVDRDWQPLYTHLDYVRLAADSVSGERLQEIINEFHPGQPTKLVITGVNDYTSFHQLKSMGARYFQGRFYLTPDSANPSELNPTQTVLAELLFETSQASLELSKIVSIVERDVALSVALLKYANSAAFAREAKVNSIRQAAVMLGQREIKRFLTLQFVLASTTGKPTALLHHCLTRAKFCETLADSINGGNATSAYLAGMLSLIDAVMDRPLEEALQGLGLNEDMEQALLHKHGPLAELLELVCAFENGQWNQCAQQAALMRLSVVQVADAHTKAYVWASEQIKGSR